MLYSSERHRHGKVLSVGRYAYRGNTTVTIKERRSRSSICFGRDRATLANPRLAINSRTLRAQFDIRSSIIVSMHLFSTWTSMMTERSRP